MSLKYIISLVMSVLIMLFYFVLQSLLVFGYVKYSQIIGIIGYTCFLGSVPFFIVVVNELIKNSKNKHR